MGSCMYINVEQDKQQQLPPVTLSNLAINKFRTSFYESFCLSIFQLSSQTQQQSANFQQMSRNQVFKSNIDDYVEEASQEISNEYLKCEVLITENNNMSKEGLEY
ncbi:Hypothetical_protein [Hexamita inflata]|uniref:Hypothetical_protein n=1 Tax=Hexamita inflata TaxID=28002 RepID=A0AA86UHZ5_9EUKA|nr:Hypothetical protein HINF_LOCUS39542 [Hexamita inflata]CAI9956960.1 Hypothetical protein HINF_LOCUS44605 [Hexamita inflata]